MPTKRHRKYSQDFSKEVQPSLTDRSFADSCDVNNIVRHYQQTGIDPHVSRRQLERFAHATSQSYEQAMRHVAEIDSAFAELPSETRSEFANDPQAWITSQTASKPAETVTDALAPPEASPEASPDPEKSEKST